MKGLDVLPVVSRLSRRDYEAQGLEIPRPDNPRCTLGAVGGTGFCQRGMHFQLMPKDACWRLRQNIRAEERYTVGGKRLPSRFTCECTSWTEGDPFPPADAECIYKGDWIAYEHCQHATEALREANLVKTKDHVLERAEEIATEAAKEAVAKRRAKDMVGAKVAKLQEELNL